MSLSPAALAFLGRPPETASTKARPVRGIAGAQCEQPNQHTKENDMPRGVYERKKPPQPTQAPEPSQAKDDTPKTRRGRTAARKAPRKAPRRAAAPRTAAARFGVFDDGSVEVRLPSCTGTLTPQEASGFLDFIKRLQG